MKLTTKREVKADDDDDGDDDDGCRCGRSSALVSLAGRTMTTTKKGKKQR
jgi:hypothetical protein